MGAGHLLRSIFEETESKAAEAQKKFETERQADIDMYRKVMLDPNASPEQRDKAAKEIEKLRNIKGKDGPFSRLSGILNTIKGHHGKMQAPASQNQEEIPSAGGGGIPGVQTQPQPAGQVPPAQTQPQQGQVPPVRPQMAPPPSSVGSAKQNVAQKAFDKVGKGLGVATGIIDRAMTGQSKSQALPPMDSSVFNYPTPAQQAQAAHVNEFKQFDQDFFEAFKRHPTQTEVDTHFKLAPNPKNPVIKVEDDKDSPTGRSYVAHDSQTGAEVWRQPNAPKPPSEEPRDTHTTTTDPYGGTTTTDTHRQLSKDKSNGKMAAPPGTTGGKGAMKPPPNLQKRPISQPDAGKGQSRGVSDVPDNLQNRPKLDGDGHIAPRAGVNERVREAANQLLDGQDVSKINPPSLRSGASMLARQYGWEQGKFTPKEQVMLKEATTFLQEASNNKSLAVLDGSFVERYKLQQVMKNPDKEGFIGRGLSLAAAQNLSPAQQEFVRMYNQLVGTISGLSQLVRSGRATEATIERLKNELPNPVTTANSEDARKRIQRLLQEVNVALEKGTFTGQSSTSQNGSKLSDHDKQILKKYNLPVN